MSELLKWHGLDVPEFEYSDIVAGKRAMQRYSQNPNHKYMVRPIVVRGYELGFDGLKDYFEQANSTFDRIAAAAGAVVVEHTFGIAKIPRWRSQQPWIARRHTDIYIPDDRAVVAQVAIVHNQQMLDEDEINCYNSATTESALNEHPLRWTDAQTGGDSQVIKGMTANDSDSKVRLVDVDLRFNGPL